MIEIKSIKMLSLVVILVILASEAIAALVSTTLLHLSYNLNVAMVHTALLFFLFYSTIYYIFLKPLIVRERELEKMKISLAQKDNRLTEYFNVAAAIIVSIDADESVSYMNKRGLETLGYRQEEVISKNWFDNFVPQRTREEERKYFVDSIRGKKPVVDYFESPVLTRSGEEKAMGWYRTVFQDAKGNITGVLRSGHDVTSLWRERELLMKRDYQLEILTRNSVHLSGARDAEAVLRNLIAAAMEITDATAGAAGLLENGKIIIREYNKSGHSYNINFVFEQGYGVPGWTLESKRPYFTNDLKLYPKAIPAIQKEFSVYNLIAIPFIGRDGDILGCFEVYNKKNHGFFDIQDVIILQGLAANAAVALEGMQITGWQVNLK